MVKRWSDVLPSTRQQKVLQAIIEDYVSSREPVGSQALVDRHGLGVSSATVRNDMVFLEEEGLIQALHPSSGRVPTPKGYRYYVDEIVRPRPLSTAEKNAIHHFLDSSDSLEEIFEQTVKLLSQLTHQVAILQLPQQGNSIIKRCDAIPLSESHSMALVITSRGDAHQRTMVTGLTRSSERRILRLLQDTCVGNTMADAAQKLIVYAEQPEVQSARELFSTFLSILSLQEPAKLLIAGTPYLAQATEDFTSSIAPVLDALEEQVTMLRLLSMMVETDHNVAVKIGQETASERLQETAVVASSYNKQAHLGVVRTNEDELSCHNVYSTRRCPLFVEDCGKLFTR